MPPLTSLFAFVHVIGVALAVGCATAKLALLRKAARNDAFLRAFLTVATPLTRLLVTGLLLATASGLGWLFIGFPLTTRLGVKLALVAAVWVLGPIIDRAADPSFRAAAPRAGEAASPEFARAARRYIRLESAATGLFYGIIVVWVLL